jgi:uncharacterized membrane protein
VGSKTANAAVVLFLIAQACDGVLTYIGVSLYGPAIEGNPVVGWLMGTMGQGLALTTTKMAAGAFGIALHLSAVHKVVAALAGFYVIVAILPWIGILFIS